MKKLVFTVEKTNTGYSAYAVGDKVTLATTGGNMKELRRNIREAVDNWTEHQGVAKMKNENIVVQVDLQQFFEFYRIINFSALGDRIGMSKSLLSQYLNGAKHPSEKQVSRILTGVKDLGRELAAIDIV